MVVAPRHTTNARTAPPGRPGAGAAQWSPTAVAALVFAAEFLRIRQWWFVPSNRWTCCYPVRVADQVLAGTARAPDQYRILGPHLADWVAATVQEPLPTGMLLVDAMCLAGTVALLHVLAGRAGAWWLPAAGAAGWAFWSSKLDHWDPTVAPLTLLVTAAVVVLADDRARRWSAPALVTIAALMCGLRTDYAAGLGVVVLAAGAARRSWPLATAGVAALAGAAAAAYGLAALYPQARYQTAVVELAHNLTGEPLAFTVAFYAPLLLPAAVLVLRRQVPPLWFVPAWFLLELAATFVVGRPEEARIFLPFAPVLAVSAVLAWTTQVRGGSRNRRS